MNQPFETITVQGRELPIVTAYFRGAPVALMGDLVPDQCDHQGSTWSACLDLRCPRCGARLFLPARFLAHRPADEIEAMYAAWRQAGYPDYPRAWTNGVPGWTFITDARFPNDRLPERIK